MMLVAVPASGDGVDDFAALDDLDGDQAALAGAGLAVGVLEGVGADLLAK